MLLNSLAFSSFKSTKRISVCTSLLCIVIKLTFELSLYTWGGTPYIGIGMRHVLVNYRPMSLISTPNYPVLKSLYPITPLRMVNFVILLRIFTQIFESHSKLIFSKMFEHVLEQLSK